MWPFDTAIFMEGILPFLIVFVLVFAVLQRSKILGDGKSRNDAIVSLVIGLILISVPVARDFIVNILPWLAVGLVVILVFLVLYGFVASDKDKGLVLSKEMKKTFLAIISLFVVILVVYFSGLWDTLSGFGANSSSWLPGAIMIIVVVVAVVIATGFGKGKDSE